MNNIIPQIMTELVCATLDHTTEKQNQDKLAYYYTRYIMKKLNVPDEEINHALFDYRKWNNITIEKAVAMTPRHIRLAVLDTIIQFTNLPQDIKSTFISEEEHERVARNAELLNQCDLTIEEAPTSCGAYVILGYNEDLEICSIKVGSAANIKKRLKQIISKKEFAKNTDIYCVELLEVYETYDRFGAYTLENMLHTHFIKLGCNQLGLDYFAIESNYDVEELDEDIPLTIMSLFYSTDKIFSAMNNLTGAQLRKLKQEFDYVEQTGKFSF